jgi:hypothetical protein
MRRWQRRPTTTVCVTVMGHSPPVLLVQSLPPPVRDDLKPRHDGMGIVMDDHNPDDDSRSYRCLPDNMITETSHGFFLMYRKIRRPVTNNRRSPFFCHHHENATKIGRFRGPSHFRPTHSSTDRGGYEFQREVLL